MMNGWDVAAKIKENPKTNFDDMEPEHKLKIYEQGVVDNQDRLTSPSDTLALRSEGVFLPRVDLDEPLSLECRHFLGCMEKRSVPLSDGKQGLEVVRILEEIEEVMKRSCAK